MNKKDIIICRCEDVTLEDLHNLMDQGYTCIEEIKRILRICMGPCQGNTCGQLVQKEISKYLKIKLEDVKTHKVRPLTTGVKLNAIAQGANDES